MKKSSLLVGFLALTMILGSATQAVAHDPLPDLDACFEFAIPIYPASGAYPVFAQQTIGSPITQLPIGQFDFCMYLDITFCMVGSVAGLVDAPEILEFADLVQCAYADINGPLNLDVEGEDLPISGNGIPDGQYELGILAAVLNNTDHPLHEQAIAAFENNFFEIKNLVQVGLDEAGYLGTVAGLVPTLMPSLVSVIAGLATMGDATTNDALNVLLSLLAEIGVEPPESLDEICIYVPELGPEGDADGDGWTNREEYSYFVGALQYSAAQYVDAALDPNQVPPQVVNIVGPARGRAAIGSNVTLTAQVLLGTPVAYQWFKAGGLLEDETGNTLSILNAQIADSGLYRVDVTVDMKDAGVYSATFNLTVMEILLPVGGMFGLTVLAGACALAGVAGLRRRK